MCRLASEMISVYYDVLGKKENRPDSHPTMLKVRVIHRHTNPLNRRKYDDFKHYSQLYRAYSQGESGPPKSRTDQRTE